MRQGDIRWVEQPDDKRRPALVLTRNETLDVLRDVMLAPLTTVIRGLPSEVPLGADDGLPRDCVANLQHVISVPKSLLRGEAGSLSPGRWHEVCAAMRAAINC